MTIAAKQFAGAIKFRGVVDFEEVYKFIFKWLEDRQFYPYEDSYIYKFPQEFFVKLRGEKKVTSYVLYRLRINFESTFCDLVDVEKDGKKKKMFSGSLRIMFFSEVETDYERDEKGNRLWEANPWTERLKNFFEKIVWKTRFEVEHPDTIQDEAFEILDEVKTLMSMHGVVLAYDRTGEE